MSNKEDLTKRVINHLLETDSSLHWGIMYQIISSLKYSRSNLIKILNFDDETTNKYIKECQKYFDNEIDYIRIN